MAYEGLLFSFAEMEQEIENFRRIAERFLERDSFERVIRKWNRDLVTFRSQSPGRSTNWQIWEQDPIQTIVSDGRFDRRAGLKVFARVSGVWQITLPNEKLAPKKGSLRSKFLLNGLASTRISIWEVSQGNPTEIARWTIELGDHASPGCHFHTQIPLGDGGGGMFPKALPVPRLPTLHHTLMDGLEFVLGELFQSDWTEQASRATAPQQIWARCQKRRFKNLLNWYLSRIEGAGGVAPWTALKQAKPEKEMLLN